MGRRTWLVTAVALAVLASGCSADAGASRSVRTATARGSGGTATARPSGGTTTTRPSGGTPTHGAATPGPLRLLPGPCARADVIVTPGPFLSPATGENGQILDVRLRGASPCTLWGTPRVRLLDAHGRTMRFRYAHRGQYLPDAPSAPVVVRAGHPAHIVVAKYRCDVTHNPPVAVAARIRLPFVRGAFALGIPHSRAAAIPRCGNGDPPQILEVSRVVGSLAATAPGHKSPPGRPYAVDLRSPFPSPIGASYGRGDLNGDGHADLVVVRRSGLVTARVSGLGRRRLWLAPDVTVRLQALSTLGHGRRDLVLVATTAHGCCGGYWPATSSASVIGLRHGHLALLRLGRAPWYVKLDDGVGDLYQGLTCTSGAVRQVSVHLLAPHRLQVVRRDFVLRGLHVRRGSRREAVVRGGPRKAMRLSQSHCPGMRSRGWASVSSYLPGRP